MPKSKVCLSIMVSTHSAVVTVGLRAPLVAIQAPTVTPQAGEVRVRVLWTASTPLDLHRNDGGLLVTYPQVLGSSVAGEVVEVGEGVTALRLEDKVRRAGRQAVPTKLSNLTSLHRRSSGSRGAQIRSGGSKSS